MPDGRQIVFQSDRDGKQQLYATNADGIESAPHERRRGGATELPSGRRAAISSPSPSSRGTIPHRRDEADGSGERILTQGFHNEGPTWAPNGWVSMFFRESPGAKGGPRLFTIDLTGYNERQVATPSFGSDPAWLPLIN